MIFLNECIKNFLISHFFHFILIKTFLAKNQGSFFYRFIFNNFILVIQQSRTDTERNQNV
ncbi:MAG TPA: hypothetical protein DHW82_10870 [Spirochaetia bacterium]|nr:MAG: hypothetical protein A2Y41_11575 [Spirochaetes bacterium GWB1_36_13]HCL57495.1 hypothetical protein [Spirochaetia bacterium]